MDWNNWDKKTIIGVAAVLIILVIPISWYFGKNSAEFSGGNSATQIGGQNGTLAQSATRGVVPSNIVVPDITSNVPANVAKPKIITEAAKDVSAKFRAFSLSVSGNKFTPDTVIVNAGDTVRLDITAVDKGYDFSQPDYGLSSPLPKGVSKAIEFQANAADKYTFYCKNCGGPTSGPVGYIIVIQNK